MRSSYHTWLNHIIRTASHRAVSWCCTAQDHIYTCSSLDETHLNLPTLEMEACINVNPSAYFELQRFQCYQIIVTKSWERLQPRASWPWVQDTKKKKTFIDWYSGYRRGLNEWMYCHKYQYKMLLQFFHEIQIERCRPATQQESQSCCFLFQLQVPHTLQSDNLQQQLECFYPLKREQPWFPHWFPWFPFALVLLSPPAAPPCYAIHSSQPLSSGLPDLSPSCCLLSQWHLNPGVL